MAKFTSVSCKGYYDYLIISYSSDTTISSMPFMTFGITSGVFEYICDSSCATWTKKSNTTGEIKIFGYKTSSSSTVTKLANKTYYINLQYATSTAAFNLSVSGKIANTKYTVTNTPTFNSNSTSLSVTTNNNVAHPCNLVVSVAGYTIFSSNITSQNTTIPISSSVIDALYPKIINSSTSAITATLKTIGHYSSPSTSKTGTYTIIQNTANSPTKPSFTYLNNHSASVTLLGTNQKFIKGFGSCIFNIPASSKSKAQKSASISKYDLVFENFKTISEVITDASKMNDTTNALTITQSLEHLGDCKVKLKVTDSRGFSTTSDAVSIFVFEYERPSLSPQLSRLNNFENQMILTIRGLIYNKASIKNTVSALKYRYSQTGTALPSTYTNISGFTYESVSQSNKNPYNETTYVTTLDYISYTSNNFIQLENDKTYNVEFVLQDALGDISVPMVVDKGIPIMGMWEHASLGGQVGINCVPDVSGNALQVKGGAQITGDLLVNQVNILASLQQLNSTFLDKTYPVGSIYLSVKNTNPGTLFGGTWAAWGTGKVPFGINTGDTSFNTVEKTGGAKTINIAHSHTVNSHKHLMTLGLADNLLYFRSDIPYGRAVNSAKRGSWTLPAQSTASTSQDYTSTTSPGTNSQLSSAQSILPPYITCYMWKRTA